MARFARLRGAALYLPAGEPVDSPPTDERGLVVSAAGDLLLLRPDGTTIGAASSAGPGNAALLRARALLGSTIDTVLGTDFDNDQWHRLTTIGGAPTAALTTTERGGVIVGDSSATASSTGVIYPHGATTIFLDNPQTSKWYAYARAALNTAIDAQTLLEIFISTAAGGDPTLRLGAIGSASTAFYAYSVSNNGGSITASGVTTIAIDLNVYHDLEMWNDGTTVSFAIDGVVVATTPATNLGTNPVVLGLLFTNGTTAASRKIKCDKLFFACARP